MKTILDEIIESIDNGIKLKLIESKSGETVKWYINTYHRYKENEFIESIKEQERSSIHLDT